MAIKHPPLQLPLKYSEKKLKDGFYHLGISILNAKSDLLIKDVKKSLNRTVIRDLPLSERAIAINVFILSKIHYHAYF